MLYSTDESALKIHVADDGYVWFASGVDAPQNSNQTVDTFLWSSPLLRITTNVRILGIAQNAELITNLYLRKRQQELASIAIAGPNICENPLELQDPYAALMRMRSSYLSTACGGWHAITDADYAIYALLSKSRRNADWFDTPARAFYEAHPVYQALNFIGGISHKDAAMLLTTIVDPRWYIDRRMPDKTSKLELYLGLTPKIQRRVSDSTKLIHGGRDLRCAIVLGCWKTSHPGVINYDLPQNFLWRVWKAAGSGVKGDLRASQAFVRYLRLNWLDVLVQRIGLRDSLFSPREFFKSPAEHEAFVQHMV